jgi:hypothetical protein
MKEVTVAHLQSAIMIPGGKTTINITPQIMPGLKMMWIEGEGLLIEHKGSQVFVPSTNVKDVWLAPKAAEAKEVKRTA